MHKSGILHRRKKFYWLYCFYFCVVVVLVVGCADLSIVLTLASYNMNSCDS